MVEALREDYARSAPGFREFELGRAALNDARQLACSQGGQDAALLLVGSAVRLLAHATLLRRELVSESTPWAEIASLAIDLRVWSIAGDSATDLADVVTREGAERHWAKMSASEREGALAALIRTAGALATPLERDASRVRRVSWARRRRLAGAILAFTCALGWVAVAVTKSRNLALHRPVEVSDRDPTYGVDPGQVVDGDRLNLGFHTSARPGTALTIDLGAAFALHRVDVYNRADCCQERAGPLSLLISSDGTDYRAMAHSVGTFYVWKARLPPATRGRFVRLVHEGPDPFHLSEVEVY